MYTFKKTPRPNNAWIQQLHSHPLTSKPLEMRYWAQDFSMDVMMAIAFGAPVGLARESKDVNHLIRSIQELFSVAHSTTTVPSLVKLIDLLFIFYVFGSENNG